MPINDFTRKLMILKPLQKLPKNVRDLGKTIVAKGFEKLPKVQKIAQSGHTGCCTHFSQTMTSDIKRRRWKRRSQPTFEKNIQNNVSTKIVYFVSKMENVRQRKSSF